MFVRYRYAIKLIHLEFRTCSMCHFASPVQESIFDKAFHIESYLEPFPPLSRHVLYFRMQSFLNLLHSNFVLATLQKVLDILKHPQVQLELLQLHCNHLLHRCTQLQSASGCNLYVLKCQKYSLA